jgi:hypothetical protein
LSSLACSKIEANAELYHRRRFSRHFAILSTHPNPKEAANALLAVPQKVPVFLNASASEASRIISGVFL